MKKNKPTPEVILEKLTGESIDTLSKNYVSMPVILTAMKLFAKAYHKEKLREDLIAFDDWYYSASFHDIKDLTGEQLVDSYLKQKQ